MPELDPKNPHTPEIVNLQGNLAFASRNSRPRDHATEIEAMRRLAMVFGRSPTEILRELVNVSIEVCAADSAGISVEEPAPGGGVQFRWIATAGEYAPYANGLLPEMSAPSASCLERNQPQLFTVPRAFLDALGVPAPEVTDGILIPWQVDGTRGTIWVVAHHSRELFDLEDYRLLQSLSYFSAIAVRHQRQQQQFNAKVAGLAAAEMAHTLAHRMHDPLQKLQHLIGETAKGGDHAQLFAQQAAEEAASLASLVKDILDTPIPG